MSATPEALSVRADGAPLGAVLERVASTAQIEVRGAPSSDAEVRARFDSLPYPEAFRRLLGDDSFLLLYGSDGRLKALQLLGGVPIAMPTTRGDLAPREKAPEEPDAGGSENAPPMPGSLRPHPIGGRLARAIGGDTGSFNQLIELAARTDDVALRREALRGTIAILDAEPELRQAIVATVQRSSTDQLARYVVFAAGPRAETVAGAIVEVMDDEPAKVRAEAVARQVALIGR